MSNRCVFILPYFGKFNNYFQLFLNSCAVNKEYDWMIITDNSDPYNYPSNCNKLSMTFDEMKELAENRLGFKICLSSPYKLCDYKPAYGYIFEEYISNYEYWGHCDCDLIFGDLNSFLPELFEKKYDKLFAAGHLTIYKNDFGNNRRFMNSYQGREIYIEAFTTESIYVFDEDMSEYNVHRLFLADGAKVYETDLSMNPTMRYARFRRSYYSAKDKRFIWEIYKPARYYWNKGEIVRIIPDGDSIHTQKFIYCHLQGRVMHTPKGVANSTVYQIMPDRFKIEKEIPKSKKELGIFTIGCPYLYWLKVYVKRIKRKIKR